jgi:uncharacterized transporter YbjL
MTRFFLTALLIVESVSAHAQPEMADTMRAEGKIYTLLAIVLIILAGLIGYLVVIDRKVGAIEKKVKETGGEEL